MAKSKKSAHPIMPSPSCISPAMERKYRTEEDLRTLQRASEIQADKSRVSAAKKLAAEQAKALTKICK